MKNKIAAIVGLLAGCSLLLYWGGEAPPWLLKLECLAVMAGALFFGFSARSAIRARIGSATMRSGAWPWSISAWGPCSFPPTCC